MDTKYLELIKAPLITEKSRTDEQNGVYTFLCDPKATKTEIKNAIEKLFKVKVVEVSTLNTKPKEKRVGRYTGLSNKYKKAMVKLAEGMTIEIK